MSPNQPATRAVRRKASQLLLRLSGAILLAGCQLASPPKSQTRELLLPVEALPANWEMSGMPKPMGSSIGFGDEDDSYVSFKLKSGQYDISFHFVLYYPTLQRAEREFSELSRSHFNDNSLAVAEPWRTPAELSYTSPYADQYRAACTINTVAGRRQVCKAMARYGQYISIFHSVIRLDTMSLAEFNDLVQRLDEMTARKLTLDL